MEDLQLSDALQRYFSDIFLCCDEENTGKASVTKALELIKSGNVPEDVVAQISEICWGQTCDHLNRQQLYSALKLVAAHQASIPLSSELVTMAVELPMPRFSWMNSSSKTVAAVASPIPDLIELSTGELHEFREYGDVSNTDSEVDSEAALGAVRGAGSPGVASSTASDSPTPTNSVQDRSWAVSGAWQGLVSEEQRQLLGTEEESSDRHSSEDDTEVSTEVWTITTEQRDYYTKQFRSLQPDTDALLAGTVARMFFEKSRLPVQELRKIWQLADVTKDGALSLQEFMIAMHLVVLRRNHIELPDVLPPQLMPGNETPSSVSPETEPILSPQTKETAKEWTKFIESPTSSVSSPGPKPVNFDFQKVALETDPKILHPVALRLTPETATTNNPPPTTEETDLSSSEGASPKKTIENFPPTTATNAMIQRPQPKKINLPGPGAIPPPPPNLQSGAQQEEGAAAAAGPISLPPALKKEKPPPPPPRPFRTHGRSSSLDLNRLSKLGAPPSVPPRVSPNMQQTPKKLVNQRSEGADGEAGASGTFADFDQFEKYENIPEDIFPGDYYEAERKKLFAQFSAPETSEAAEPPRKHGAFEVYRKTTTPSKSRESPTPTATAEDKVKWEQFQQLQETNAALLRICQELSQELADLKQEKTMLKVKLEKQSNGG